jgi:hypothetical protein
MNKYQTNNKRGGVSPSLRPPSPSFRGQVPVRHNIRSLVSNNDIDRELLSQSAEFDGPDIEIQSILSTKDQSIIHDLVLAQKHDRYLSSVLNDTNDDDQEEEENIENDHEVVIGDGTSDKTDLTSFSGLIFDNKNIDIDTKAEEITNILDAMSDQSLGFILESITKEMEKRKVTASAILNGVSTAARAGLEGSINYNAPKTGRRPSLENGDRKASPSLNNKTYVKSNINNKPNAGSFNSVKKATGNNASSISKTLTQKIPNKSKTTVVGISKKPTPIKGTSINVRDLQEESRECDFDEELRQINISPTLRTSFDGLPLPDKNKNQQQKVNNRHGAAHPNEKMFKTGLRYNPSPPTTTVPKSRDFPSVITEALNFFSGKKPKSKKEKEDEDFILVEAIKAKNARRVDNIVNSIGMLSDDESSNGLSSFSVSKSTAFDDRSAGSYSSRMSAK